MKRICRMVSEEPYRIFFPSGVVAGIFGVMLWPMFYAGWLGFYPGDAHTRINRWVGHGRLIHCHNLPAGVPEASLLLNFRFGKFPQIFGCLRFGDGARLARP